MLAMRLFLYFFLTFLIALEAAMSLDHLDEYDKENCLELLETVELGDLWNDFLSIQTDLYFPQEVDWIKNQKSWQNTKDVLELGSGNGAYLNKLSENFKDKNYLGVEKQFRFVSESSHRFSKSVLRFREGDAEIRNNDLENQFDIVLFRLTLQHLKNPRLALEHAYHYLRKGGHIFIIESFDSAKQFSHKISSLEDASTQHNENNKKENKGNRRITIEILEELTKCSDLLGHFYKIEFTSLSNQGQILENVVKFEKEHERKLYFTQALMFLAILKKGYGVTVDFSKAYEELKVILKDEKAWVCPGMHYLILKKI